MEQKQIEINEIDMSLKSLN